MKGYFSENIFFLLKMNISQFLIQILSIGAVTAIVFLLLSLIIEPNSVLRILVLGFLTGALVHILFELTGGNVMYCKTKLLKK
jgi:hypothetical protein